MCPDFYATQRFMLNACVIGMCNGDYLFILPTMNFPYEMYFRDETADAESKHAYKYVLLVSVLSPLK